MANECGFPIDAFGTGVARPVTVKLQRLPSATCRSRTAWRRNSLRGYCPTGASGGPPSGIAAHIDIVQRSPDMQALTPPSPPPPMVVQQGWPAPPHAPQVPGIPEPVLRPAQPNPVEQVPLLPEPQQGWASPPQVPQAAPVAASVQPSPDMQALTPPSPPPPMVAQQGWPVPPHAPQVPGIPEPVFRPTQANPVEQVPLLPEPQQGWLSPPQVPQAAPVVASMQPSPDMQALTPPSPPPPMVVQQGWPAPPQAPHVPGMSAPVFRPAQPNPLAQVPLPPLPQQTWPEAPHAAHWSPPAATTQLRPVAQSICPAQQGWPAAPQAAHVPPPPSTWPPHTMPG